MYAHYFYWQYVAGPRWLAVFLWRLQIAIVQFFSVPVMIRTIAAPWRRDRLAYRGRLDQILEAFLLNQISRGIGFIIRLSVLAIWMVVEAIFLVLAACFWLLFLAAPFFLLVGLAIGIAMLQS